MAAPGFFAKQALKAAVQNPDKVKKILIAVIITFVVILMLPAIMLQTISSLFGDKEIGADFNITEMEAYKVVKPIYTEYLDTLNKKMEEMAESIREANTTTDSDGNTVCTVDVYITINQDNLATLFSYLSLTDPNIQEAKKYKADKAAIKAFYDQICSIKTDQPDTDTYHIYNVFFSAEEVAQLYFPNDESQRELYMVSYNNFKDFLDPAMESGSGQQAGEAEEEYTGELIFAANGMEIPLYRQWEEPWGSAHYGFSTIKSSGCAPTSLAMIITYLTGNTVTPDVVVAWTGNRYYVPGVGSSWGIFGACAGHWGIKCTNLGKNKNLIIDSLENGHPIIASMGPGTFTKGGHLIVLRGITEEGRILVNDPADSDSKNHINKSFSIDLIMRESKNFWSFQ